VDAGREVVSGKGTALDGFGGRCHKGRCSLMSGLDGDEKGRWLVMTEKNTTCTGRRKLQRRPLAHYYSGIVRSAATASEVLCIVRCGSGRGKVATRRRVRMPAVR